MNRIALNVFSYFDTGKKPSGTEPEWKCEADASHYYHGFVLGLLVELQVSWIFRF